jgi:hypothetical protein
MGCSRTLISPSCGILFHCCISHFTFVILASNSNGKLKDKQGIHAAMKSTHQVLAPIYLTGNIAGARMK